MEREETASFCNPFSSYKSYMPKSKQLHAFFLAFSALYTEISLQTMLHANKQASLQILTRCPHGALFTVFFSHSRNCQDLRLLYSRPGSFLVTFFCKVNEGVQSGVGPAIYASWDSHGYCTDTQWPAARC